MNIPKLIQIGDKTHHHDQSITWVNLRTMKAIVNNPANPIPPLDEDDEEDIPISFLEGSNPLGELIPRLVFLSPLPPFQVM